MSRQRMCTRAYWEYRELFDDLCSELKKYSDQWKIIVESQFKPKCEILGYCQEHNSCGIMPKKEDVR
jgi:thymidylate synthase (FAD)